MFVFIDRTRKLIVRHLGAAMEEEDRGGMWKYSNRSRPKQNGSPLQFSRRQVSELDTHILTNTTSRQTNLGRCHTKLNVQVGGGYK